MQPFFNYFICGVRLVACVIEPHAAMVYVHYNFARFHQTLRVTPAMEDGVSDHVWSFEEIVGLLA
jgi:hypothetical protein